MQKVLQTQHLLTYKTIKFNMKSNINEGFKI